MLALGALLAAASPADAQTAAQPATSTLPAVTVDAPKPNAQRAAPQRRTASRSGEPSRRARQAANPSAQSQAKPAMVSTAERVNAGTNGFVASRASGATKTDSPIMSTPGSVAVITREEMDVRRAQSIRDLLRYAPGIYFSNDTDFRFQPIKARGFDVEQYLDGLRLQGGPFGIPRIDPYFLDRAEIITGPASILYGAASPGGILNMVSKRPTDKAFGEVSLQTGSFDRIQGAFDVGGPVNKDKTLLYRVTGLGLNANTQVDHIGEERFAIAPAWTWRPDIDTTITFLTSYRQDPKGGAFALLPYQGTLVPGTYGQIPRNFFGGDFNYESLKYKQATLGYEFEHRFDDVFTVRQNVRYLHNELNYVEVQPNGFTTPGPSPTLPLVDGRTIKRNYFSTNENLNTFAADNQLQAKFNMGPLQHTVLAGFDYQRYDFNNFARFAATNTLDILAPNYTQNIAVPTAVFQNLDQHLQQRGVYVQDEAKLGRLTVLGGVRYDWAEGNTLAQNLGTRVLNDDQKPTGRIGAIYNFDNGIAPYLSYSTSFQPTRVGMLLNNQPYRPTTGEQVEGGIKYQPPGTNILFTAAAFELKQENVVVTRPDNTTDQVGEVTSRGFEGSVVGNPLPGLSIRGQYSYLDNRITGRQDQNYGKVLANTPMHTASLWANYLVQSGPAAGFGFGGGVRYVHDMYTTDTNNLTVPTIVPGIFLPASVIPASTTFDAALSYDFGMRYKEWKGLSAALNVNNVFDRSYVSACAAAGCRWALGRTVLATLTYRW
jgi:iron complex outermembrane recepter protein